MAVKVATFFILSLLLCCSTLSAIAARPEPAFADGSLAKTQSGVVEGHAEDSCEGIGEDECLMRRTLAAHIDYIYTQDQSHKP
ncbi:Phytosulfokines 3 precursor family protein [Tripterygium wilfordii]|uniref:Phytosulfokine n=1 Tax=Tripterygium wilfordii TaxID=458696 RepID=A0A7J7DLW1_TRIWF|nr:phytosulfokines-like [Tripterygium wilfordii]KAF5747283.1 Phytosulfokines 3 precursor family protein [Tripterygium wilfordii]